MRALRIDCSLYIYVFWRQILSNHFLRPTLFLFTNQPSEIIFNESEKTRVCWQVGEDKIEEGIKVVTFFGSSSDKFGSCILFLL